MEKYESIEQHSQGVDNRDESKTLRNSSKGRAVFKKVAPIVLGVASLFGGELQATAQSNLPEQKPQEVERFREFGKSRFGLNEITKVANGVLLGVYSKDHAQELRKQLVEKYGESAVEFGFQFEREEIQIANAIGEKLFLQNNSDEASKDKMVKLDADSNTLEARHAVEELALDSLLEKSTIDNAMGTHRFSVRVEHPNGSLPGVSGKNITKTDRIMQVSYEKYQATTGESEETSSWKMEQMLNDYLKEQGMNIGAVRAHYNFEYLVKDPASSPDHPSYLLVEGVSDEPVK